MPDPPPSKRRPHSGVSAKQASAGCHWLLASGAKDSRGSYAELHVKTNFSFLEGASHPDELVQRAVELGLNASSVAKLARAKRDQLQRPQP